MLGKIKQNDVILVEKLREFAKHIKILIAEDSEQFRLNVCESLKLASFKEIGIAENGEKALLMHAANKYDVILTDINMPVKSGIDIIKELRNNNDDAYIIVMTAHNESTYYNELIELGVNGFLSKPFSLMLLLFTLSQVCKTVYESKKIKELKEEVIKEQNKTIAYAYAIEHEQKNDLNYLRKSYEVISAQEFSENYPMDTSILCDKLEAYDEQLDMHVDRFLTTLDSETKQQVIEVFNKYGETLGVITEFENIAVAFKHFAEFLSENSNFTNIQECKEMLFCLASDLREWRTAIFIRKDAHNIHYLDASMINNIMIIEAKLKDETITGSEIEFF